MNRMNYLFQGIIAALMVLLLSAGAVRANAAPTAPKNLTVTTASVASNGVKVKIMVLNWQSGTPDNTPKDYDGFKIYGGRVEANTVQFSLLATVNNSTFTYNVTSFTTAGTYKFYVASYKNDAQSPTESVSFVFNPVDTGNGGGTDAVRFTTEPVRTGAVGVAYTYDANAVATSGGDVFFTLMSGPDGMTINRTTGVISWTPKTNGTFNVKIKAFLASDSTKFVYQAFSIVVGSANNNDSLHFTTEFKSVAYYNELYSYDANAAAAGNPVIRFALVSNNGAAYPSGMALDTTTGILTWTPGANSPATVPVVLKAYLASDPTKYVLQTGTITVKKRDSIGSGGGDAIRFTSLPVTVAVVNKAYTYDANAVSATSGTVLYALMNVAGTVLPQGMTIDSVTGVVTWTPSTAGQTITYQIKAYLAGNPAVYAIQKVTVTVRKCETPAIVTGTVKDKNGNYVPGVTVIARGANSNEGIKVIAKEGVYRLELDEGTYIITVLTTNEITGSTSQQISVKCGGIDTVNLTVERNIAVISGRVTRASDGTGLADVRIDLMGYAAGTADKVMTTITVRTNAEGYYTATVPALYSYIARATPPNDLYDVQYFENSATLANATRISGNRTGVNFALTARRTYSNGISGTVVDSAGNPVPAIVVAYRITDGANTGDKRAAVTVETDSLGRFTITNLAPGSYILQVRPRSKDLAGGYYKLNAPAVIEWAKATKITVGENGVVSGITILVPKSVRKNGLNKLIGTVGGTAGITQKDGGAHVQSAALPVADAFVTILDNAGKVSDYTFADDNGNFQLADLTPGAYTLKADMVGYANTSSAVTIDTDPMALAMVDVTLQNSGSSGVTGPDASANALLLSLLPNTVSTSTVLRFAATAGTARISIIDQTGAVQSIISMQTHDGVNTAVLSTTALPAGQYFVRVQSAQASGLARMAVVK